MELLALILLYLLTQNPEFSQKLQPILEQLKNSENALRFLKDFSAFSGGTAKKDPPKQEEKEKPQSPTKGIADEFIETLLNEYLKR